MRNHPPNHDLFLQAREFLPDTHVVILSSHSLFREGLKRVLAEEPMVKITGFAQTVEEVEQMTKPLKPDFVIVERVDEDPLDTDNIARLLEIPNVRVLTVSLEESDIQVYRRELFGEATAEKLIALLTKAEI